MSFSFQVLEFLEELVDEGSDKIDVRDKAHVIKRMLSSVGSKQSGQETILCPLIAEVITNKRTSILFNNFDSNLNANHLSHIRLAFKSVPKILKTSMLIIFE